MNFKNLKNFAPARIKALFGFHPIILGDILIVLLPELERRRAENLAKRPNRKRPPIANDGKPREVMPCIRY